MTHKCTHPDHSDKETCADRAVSCHKDCHCCNGEPPAPAYDADDVSLLLNLVVGQKNEVLKLINDGYIIEAQTVLQVLRPLWQSVGYTYKYNELMQRTSRGA